MSIYNEDKVFVLPNIKEGVSALGDLWDCHESKYLNINLFKEYLSAVHLKASQISDMEYKLTHLKTVKDKVKHIDVEGSLELEVLAGLIKVDGSADLKIKSEEARNFEQIACYYFMQNYLVDVLPKAKEILNENVVAQLKNQLKATHYVSRVIVGAEVDVSIEVESTSTKNQTDIKGKLI